MWPIALIIINLCFVGLAGMAGAAGLLLAGEWQAVLLGLAAGMAIPFGLPLLHWLRWLFDIPAMFAHDARWHRLAAIFAYLADLFVCLLMLGWLAAVVHWIAPIDPAWAALCWGHALAAGPLLLIVLLPAGYPLLMLLVAVIQIAWPLAWAAHRLAGIPIDSLLDAIGLLILLLPLVEFLPRWRAWTRPD